MNSSLSLGSVALSEAECLRVLVRFYRHLDALETDALCTLMHEPFMWLRQGLELRSRADIEDSLSQRPPDAHLFHMLGSVTFDPLGGNHVRYSGYLIVLRAQADPTAATRMPPTGAQSLHLCEGELRRTEHGWRISEMDAGPPRLLMDL